MTIKYKNVTNLNKYFRILKSKALQKKIDEIFMSKTEKTKNVVEAFHISMIKNYPVIPAEWILIDVSEGYKMLEDFMSPNTFKKYVSLGYFRSKENKVFKDEVERYRDTSEMIYNFYSKKILQELDDFGVKSIVLFPSSITKLGLSNHNQKLRGGFYMLNEKWFQDWAKAIDFE
jgi:hypothetical protein